MTDGPLIPAAEAVRLHGAGGALFMDASFHLPATGRDARAEFEAERVPGAVFFDIDAVADPRSPLPHTMPEAAVFEGHMRRLGLDSSDRVVVYDRSVFYSSARAWYMLRLFGHGRVQVLDGGLKAFTGAGGPVETGAPEPPPEGGFTASAALGGNAVAGLDDMRSLVATAAGKRAFQILDARSPGRFNGTDAEPRPGLRGGHMPGAVNVPIGSLIDKGTGLFRDKAGLEEAFGGVDLEKPIVTTCGSGVTACGLALGLAVLGIEGVRLYDGSWSEWGGRDDCPVA